MTRRPNPNGFTLVELMVALVIFAMLATAGVALLSFAVRAQAGAAVRLDDVAATRRMSTIVANDLAQALPRVARASDGGTVRAFTGNDGTSDPLVFGYVRGGRTNPGNAARASAQRVEIRLIDHRLERWGYSAIDGDATHNDILLANQVTALAMRYRDRRGEWHPRWDNLAQDSVPAAVEMTVTREHGQPLTFDWASGTGYP